MFSLIFSAIDVQLLINHKHKTIIVQSTAQFNE